MGGLLSLYWQISQTGLEVAPLREKSRKDMGLFPISHGFKIIIEIW
jgi:hypothetical protein